MPNSIKYSASAQTLALKKGNLWIGTGDVGKGPSSSTAYYNGVTPAAGGYTIYSYSATQTGNLSYFSAANDAALIAETNRIAGTSYTTAAQCLTYFAGQTDRMVCNIDYPPIVTDGLVVNFDAGFTPSYPTTGTIWYDVSSGGNNGSLTGSVLPTFSTNPSTLVFTRSSISSLPQNFNSVTCNNTVGDDMTVSSWIKTTEVGYSTQHYELMYIASSEKGGAANDWGFGINVNGRIAFGAGTNDGTISGGIVNTGIWCSVVATRVKSTGLVTLYVNGSLSNSGTSNIGNTLNANPLIKIGSGDDYPAFSFGGSIATTQIYNRALTAAEVLQNYNATKGRFGL
jgi:hypothetical protein